MHEIALISERHARRITAGCLLAVGGLLALHYSTSLGSFGMHDFLRRLFYLPVALAALGEVGLVVGVIQKEVARARRLLRDMRDFGSLSRRPEGTVDLPALVGGIVEDVATAHPRMVRVSTPFPGAGIRIRADRGALAHTLRSLLIGILDSVALEIPREAVVRVTLPCRRTKGPTRPGLPAADSHGGTRYGCYDR